MKRLERTEKDKAYSEEEAKEYIETQRINAAREGYTVKKAGYEYKTKKAKGEIVDECWIVSVTKVFNDVWEAEE